MKKLAEHARTERLVIFAGAGVSMPPPTSLPGWKAVNELILAALTRRLAVFTGPRFAEDIMTTLIATREQVQYFSPDYQAQLIEDECGLEYFRVLQALDTEDRNLCHDTIAALAARGCVAAIITTNFDCLLERACEVADVPKRVFYDHTHWKELPCILAAGEQLPLPIIKVHGSANAPASMVDTLRQRLAGRPALLESTIRELLARHHVLFVGFSGADLAYDENYLGLKAAASDNRGFTCLLQQGREPSAGMAALRAAWGDGARFLEGSLPKWLVELAAELNVPAPAIAQFAAEPNRLAAVSAHADKWAESLGHMLAVAIMAELLTSSNRESIAFDLLIKTYRSFIKERDMEAPGYARFNYQIGHRMLERGKFDNSVDPMREREVRREKYSTYTGNDCFQCLHRAATGPFLQGYIDWGLYDALKGMPQQGAQRIRAARERALQNGDWTAFIDACRTLSIVYEILMQYGDGLDWLDKAYTKAHQIGDEPRRARICAEQARFLAMKRRFSEAHEQLIVGRRIADNLGLKVVHFELLSAEGSVRVEEHQPVEALASLDLAIDGFRKTGRSPALARTLLDVCYASFSAGDFPRLDAAQDELLSNIKWYPGYAPLALLAFVRLHIWSGHPEKAMAMIPEVKRIAAANENPGVIEEIGILEKQLA